MLFTNPWHDIRLKMNESGAGGRPFLFAGNVELSEGYFVAEPARVTSLFYSTPLSGNKPSPPLPPIGNKGGLKISPLSREAYKAKFEIISRGLHRGDSYLTNLTVRTPIECALSLEEIFLLSDSPYQLLVPGRFVCFSPERFVHITGGRISTNPMKGTIDAATPEAERVILENFKETAEHNTIVDLLRNDLSLWAEQVHVERSRYIDRIRSREREILQVSSEIVGTLPADYPAHLGDLIFSMLPAGSCTGAPKSSTIRLIQEAEGEARGYYTGFSAFSTAATWTAR
jgi:para-aminobenzoate synthetase component 1